MLRVFLVLFFSICSFVIDTSTAYLNENISYPFFSSDSLGVSCGPNTINLKDNENVPLVCNITCMNCNGTFGLQFSIERTSRAIVDTTPFNFTYDENEDELRNITVYVKGVLLGKTYMEVKLMDLVDFQEFGRLNNIDVIIFRNVSILDDIFLYSVIVFVIIVLFALGCDIELQVVKEILRRPMSPIIGILSQFTIMPLVAYGLGVAFQLSQSELFGLFATGCVPSGGGSNVWTSLLGGNLNLSMTLTTLSLLFSFGFMPFWYFTLGRTFGSSTQIPYANIATSTLSVLVPCSLGILIRWKFPKVAKRIRYFIHPLNILFVLYVSIFGSYVNLFMYYIMYDTPMIIAASCLLPYLGYTMGALIARISCREKIDIIAMAIEVGNQNTGLAIILLRLSLPQPESDISSVIPIVTAIASPIPLGFLYSGIRIYKCVTSRRSIPITEV